MRVDTPTWYVVRDGEIIGIISCDECDTFRYRGKASKYPDSVVWCCIPQLGWVYMRTNFIRTAIWQPSVPPDIVKMAHLIQGGS